MSIRSWAPLTWAKGPNDDTEQINKQNANAGDTITDDITVTGSNGFEGTVTSVLYGPVAPLGSPAAATCVGVDYTNAPVAGTFEVEVDGDGTYTTAPFTVLVAGCYTYSETLNTVPPVGPSMRGRSSETVLVFPKVTTQISKQTANVGDTITDDIKVFGSGSYKGLVNWTLLGPVAPRLPAPVLRPARVWFGPTLRLHRAARSPRTGTGSTRPRATRSRLPGATPTSRCWSETRLRLRRPPAHQG
ncbi:MAG: hypothetical protein H0U15_06635 [Geodermatophilaceae bacterium]|jgi:hypothetical protein|nr:hypothetical protein [Geodermatophilaceae bacterium]